jgi:hypothetical protein
VLEDQLYRHFCPPTTTSTSESESTSGGMDDDLRVGFPTLLAMVAGGVSGGMHGAAQTLWDHTARALSPPDPKSRSGLFTATTAAATATATTVAIPAVTARSLLCGTMVSHTLVHGTLFGSYELAKRSSLVLVGINTERDTSRVEGECVVKSPVHSCSVLLSSASAACIVNILYVVTCDVQACMYVCMYVYACIYDSLSII